jgi:acetyl-CoA carboxylase biotin carboxyl carrier protein
MTTDEIKELIQVVRDTGIAELEVQRGENRVRIKGAAFAHDAHIAATAPPQYVAHGPVMAASASQPPPAAEPLAVAPSPRKEDDHNIVVKSPIVGTYYDAPSPGASPFVNEGDRVEPKTVLCIIESMKLMNEIEAEIRGVVVAKHLENGRPVEYGESLFTIQPL